MENPWWRWSADQPWLYWLFDPEWWISATQGAVGALIGFIGLFAVYRITQMGEKKKKVEEQFFVGIAKVTQAALTVSRKGYSRDKILEFQNELMLLYVHLAQDRPEVAKWARAHFDVIEMRYSVDAFYNCSVDEAVKVYCENIINDLTIWLKKGAPDKDMPHIPDSIKEWEIIVKKIKDSRRFWMEMEDKESERRRSPKPPWSSNQ